jgi:hypothetical protein
MKKLLKFGLIVMALAFGMVFIGCQNTNLSEPWTSGKRAYNYSVKNLSSYVITVYIGDGSATINPGGFKNIDAKKEVNSISYNLEGLLIDSYYNNLVWYEWKGDVDIEFYDQ